MSKASRANKPGAGQVLDAARHRVPSHSYETETSIDLETGTLVPPSPSVSTNSAVRSPAVGVPEPFWK